MYFSRKTKNALWRIACIGIKIYFNNISKLAYYFLYQFKQKTHLLLFPKEQPILLESETLAIYAIYQPKALSSLIKRSIRYLYENKIRIMIVAPHAITPNDINFLTENGCIVLTRCNFGRDFASYKYGILYLLNHPKLFAPFKKLLLINDSLVFPIQENDSNLKKILNYHHDVVGLIENYEFNWHIGSYFILIRKELLLNKALQQFWINYKPYSSRFHAIKKGEIAFGKKIRTLTSAYTIIYNSENFLNFIKKLLHSQLDENYKFTLFTSRHFRVELFNNFLSLESFESLAKLKNKFENFSAIHHFAFALIKYLDCFCMKRDICYRGLYTIDEVIQFIESTNADSSLVEALHCDLKNKQMVKNMPFLKKVLVASGAI